MLQKVGTVGRCLYRVLDFSSQTPLVFSPFCVCVIDVSGVYAHMCAFICFEFFYEMVRWVQTSGGSPTRLVTVTGDRRPRLLLEVPWERRGR